MADGSIYKYYCGHPQRTFGLYNLCDDKANADPRFNWAERKVVDIGSNITGHNQMLCVAEKDISFPNNPNNSEYTESPTLPMSPRSPTDSPHNPFTW